MTTNRPHPTTHKRNTLTRTILHRALTLKREVVCNLAAPTLDALPKQISWQCQTRPIKRSFACTIKRVDA